jgi:hypothetical protein
MTSPSTTRGSQFAEVEQACMSAYVLAGRAASFENCNVAQKVIRKRPAFTKSTAQQAPSRSVISAEGANGQRPIDFFERCDAAFDRVATILLPESVAAACASELFAGLSHAQQGS